MPLATDHPTSKDIDIQVNTIADLSGIKAAPKFQDFSTSIGEWQPVGTVNPLRRRDGDDGLSWDEYVAALGSTMDEGEANDLNDFLVIDEQVLGRRVNETSSEIGEGGLERREYRRTTFSTRGERQVSGTRSVPYDFGASKNADCSDSYCSNQGNGGLTGTTDMGNVWWNNGGGRAGPIKSCTTRRAELRLRIYGQFKGRNSLEQVSSVMKRGLELTQTGEWRETCYRNSFWMSNIWKVVPSANVNNYKDSNLMNFMTVTMELTFEKSFECQFIKGVLNSLNGFSGQAGGFIGELIGLAEC